LRISRALAIFPPSIGARFLSGCPRSKTKPIATAWKPSRERASRFRLGAS
jgi:hypothetical protein